MSYFLRNYLFLLIRFSAFVIGEDNNRGFSIFSIVSFVNLECESTDPSAPCGTCFSSPECADLEGRASGNCASGFGVCCLFVFDTCGAIIDKNISYFRSPGFPNTFGDSGVCTYTIQRCRPNVCSIRLDFDSLSTSEPTDGACGMNNFDKITVTSPSGSTPPGPGGLCGDGLSGMHMYVDTSLMGPVTFSISVGSAPASVRLWNIKVNQITCNDMNRPPQGCTQFFTGFFGSIKSYNFDGGQINDGHLYTNCIRQEEGFCSITYTAIGDNDFKLKATQLDRAQDVSIAIDCDNTAVVIPGVDSGGSSSILEFCGGKFNRVSTQTAHGAATGKITPFRFVFRSKIGADADGLAGHNLMYYQVPC